MAHFPNLKGIDYDFEPPIDLETGGQLPVGPKTTEDYKNLFELLKASRQTLGTGAYISVTITANRDYLKAINQSVQGGWFKQVAPYVDSLNLMTFDLQGAWGQGSGHNTTIHSYIKQPETARGKDLAVHYDSYRAADLVLSYGLPPGKLQLGIAAYGRGYSGVPAGENGLLPGFEQAWKGKSVFPAQYMKEKGILPYKAIGKVIKDLGYTEYQIDAFDDHGLPFASGAYIYHGTARQFVGYQSPKAIESLCKFIKERQLKGVILWNAEMDLPVSNPDSLIANYRRNCFISNH
jgi:chitinase